MMRAETRGQGTAFLNSAGKVHIGGFRLFAALCPPMHGHKEATVIDLGVTNKF